MAVVAAGHLSDSLALPSFPAGTARAGSRRGPGTDGGVTIEPNRPETLSAGDTVDSTEGSEPTREEIKRILRADRPGDPTKAPAGVDPGTKLPGSSLKRLERRQHRLTTALVIVTLVLAAAVAYAVDRSGLQPAASGDIRSITTELERLRDDVSNALQSSAAAAQRDRRLARSLKDTQRCTTRGLDALARQLRLVLQGRSLHHAEKVPRCDRR